jgi:predicted nucleic acid-binding protein
LVSRSSIGTASSKSTTQEALDRVVDTMGLVLREVPRPALFLAAKASAQYRQRGGSKTQVLPDFFIGAHAAVAGWPLLTRDAARYKTYFPGLTVLAP